MLVHQRDDDLLRDAASQGMAGHVGDLGGRAASVDGVQDREEQRGELERLTVAATHQRGWVR